MDAAREWPEILLFGTGDTITEEIVERRYRQLSKKFHPDAGGTVEDMQQLNAARQLALRWIATEQKRRQELLRAQEAAARQFAMAAGLAAQTQQANAFTSLYTNSREEEPKPPAQPEKRSKVAKIWSFLKENLWE